MHKYIIHILLSIFLPLGQIFAQNVEIPDEEFAAALCEIYVGGNIMDNACDSLNTVNAGLNSTTAFNLSEYSTITSVEGIEYLTNITDLDISGNNINSLDDILALPSLENVNLANNKLTYSELHKVHEYKNGETVFSPFPQQNTTENQVKTVKEHSDFTIKYTIDEGVDGLFFEWYRNGVKLEGKNDRELFIEDIGYEEVGIYSVRIRSVKMLDYEGWLQSGTWDVKVEDSLMTSEHTGKYNYKITQHQTCDSLGVKLDWFQAELVENLKYKFLEKTTSTSYPIEIGETIKIDSGSYNLLINDSGTFGLQIWDVIEIAPPVGCNQPAASCVGYNEVGVEVIETCDTLGIFLDYAFTENSSINSFNIVNQETGVEESMKIGDTLLLDPGDYYLLLSDDTSGCTLAIDTIYTLEEVVGCVEPCIGTYDYQFENNVDCKTIETQLIHFDSENQNELKFQLHNISSDWKSDFFTIETPVSLFVGEYNLLLDDSQECIYTIENAVTIEKPLGCETLFSPDGDGINDTWYIDGEGVVKISTIEGAVVRSLDLPANWDGTDNSGNSLPIGMYIIVFPEGTVEKVSLVK